MRVLFVYDHDQVIGTRGGGKTQVEQTRDHLRALGVTVEEADTRDASLPSGFDIAHFFGGDPQSASVAVLARSKGMKVAVSTIFWYMHAHVFHNPTIRLPKKLKNIGYWLAKRLLKGKLEVLPQYRIYGQADLLLPNSGAETRTVKRYFSPRPGARFVTIPYGVEDRFGHTSSKAFVSRYGLRDFLLCVGILEPKKNQLGLIEALKTSDIQVVFIGPEMKDGIYGRMCRDRARPGMHFLGYINYEDPILASAYVAARALIMPSFHETCGLVALEAGLAGLPLAVTSTGGTREYFGDFAECVDPLDPKDIRRKSELIMSKPRQTDFVRHIRANFTWKRTAEKTLKAYRSVLGRSRSTASSARPTGPGARGE